MTDTPSGDDTAAAAEVQRQLDIRRAVFLYRQYVDHFDGDKDAAEQAAVRDAINGLDAVAALSAPPSEAPREFGTLHSCGVNIGDGEVCRCLLPRGHTGMHQCRHNPAGESKPGGTT